MSAFIKRESIISKVFFLLALCIVISFLTSCSSTPVSSSGGSLFSNKITPVSEFSNGLAVIERDGEYGYIDTTGRVVIPIQFSKAASFKDGAALVTLFSEDGTSYDAYIDAHGEVVFDFREYKDEYDTIFQYSGGLLGVVKRVSGFNINEDQYGFIDLSGNIVMPLQGTWEVTSKNLYENGYVWLKNKKTKEEPEGYNTDISYSFFHKHEFKAINTQGEDILHAQATEVRSNYLGIHNDSKLSYNFAAGCLTVEVNAHTDPSEYNYNNKKENYPEQFDNLCTVFSPFEQIYKQKTSTRNGEAYWPKTFMGDYGEGMIVAKVGPIENYGVDIYLYDLIDVTAERAYSGQIDTGSVNNELKELYGFSDGISAIDVVGQDGKTYSYYIKKSGNVALSPQTEYQLGDFNNGYAIWRKSGEDGKPYAYIVNKDFKVISDPIPFDGDISQRLRFKNGYCLLTQDGVAKYIDTQGETLVIQDYQKGQAPIELTDEMRIPDLSAPPQTPSPATTAPQSPLSASPSAEPTQPPQASPSPNSYPITDNMPIDEIVDMVAGGMYFVNRDNGYVAYIVDVWDGCGSVFVNGKELLQFEVYDYKHEKGDISTGPFIKFYGTNPEPEDLPIVTFDYTRGWIRITGEYEGERFNGIYDYAPTEPPIPSDRVWGDYSSALLEEMAELDRMAEGAGDDDYY